MVMFGVITDVPGIRVGHYTDKRAVTGCTVILCERGAVAGVDVSGSSPGTRETELLHPGNLVEKVQAIVLSGGSAFDCRLECYPLPSRRNQTVVSPKGHQACNKDLFPSLKHTPACCRPNGQIGSPEIGPGIEGGLLLVRRPRS